MKCVLSLSNKFKRYGFDSKQCQHQHPTLGLVWYEKHLNKLAVACFSTKWVKRKRKHQKPDARLTCVFKCKNCIITSLWGNHQTNHLTLVSSLTFSNRCKHLQTALSWWNTHTHAHTRARVRTHTHDRLSLDQLRMQWDSPELKSKKNEK